MLPAEELVLPVRTGFPPLRFAEFLTLSESGGEFASPLCSEVVVSGVSDCRCCCCCCCLCCDKLGWSVSWASSASSGAAAAAAAISDVETSDDDDNLRLFFTAAVLSRTIRGDELLLLPSRQRTWKLLLYGCCWDAAQTANCGRGVGCKIWVVKVVVVGRWLDAISASIEKLLLVGCCGGGFELLSIFTFHFRRRRTGATRLRKKFFTCFWHVFLFVDDSQALIIIIFLALHQPIRSGKTNLSGYKNNESYTTNAKKTYGKKRRFPKIK